MSPSNTMRLLSAALLLAGLSACDRAPRGQAAKPAPATPTAAAPAIEAGATTTAMPDATVALSGAVRDLPPATTPDSAVGKPAAPTPAAAAVRPPPPVDTTPRTAPPGETAAMREFREAQERRDRELLERDMDASRGGLASNEDEPPRDDARADDDRYRDAREGRDEDLLPPDDELASDDVPLDEDPPAYDEEVPPEDEDLPPEDEDLRWDPATGTWR